MFKIVLFNILSFLFFSNYNLCFNLADYSYGEILKLSESQYFSEKVEKIESSAISASSAVVLDLRSSSFILEKNPDESWPIASISKIMATLVLLEDLEIDLDLDYRVQVSDRRLGGRDYLFFGDELSRRNLLALSLIASDNTAVIALISSAGLDEDFFVDLMNQKAQSLDLNQTHFKDATGLSPENVSTAKEVAKLLEYSFKNQIILDLVQEYDYSFSTKQGRLIQIRSTNELLNGNYRGEGFKVLGGKTGYNDLSGYCLGVKFIDNNKNEFIAVVLNASSLKNRFIDSRELIDEVIKVYNN